MWKFKVKEGEPRVGLFDMGKIEGEKIDQYTGLIFKSFFMFCRLWTVESWILWNFEWYDNMAFNWKKWNNGNRGVLFSDGYVLTLIYDGAEHTLTISVQNGGTVTMDNISKDCDLIPCVILMSRRDSVEILC